jgi:hypothetical protein
MSLISRKERAVYDTVFLSAVLSLMAYTGFRLYIVYSEGTNLALG